MSKRDAACFAEGMSVQATRKISGNNPTYNKSNTMKGMRGCIDTGQSASTGGAKGGSGAGPKKEGPIGRKGSSGPFPSTARGTMSKNALGHRGRMESLKGRAKTSYEK